MDEKKERPSAVKWTQANEVTMVHMLDEAKKIKGHWGDNNPKPPAWTMCKEALKGSEKRSGGVPKTTKSISNRWNQVSLLSWTVCATDTCPQIKQEYDAVKELRGLSGFGWDPQLCTVTAEHDVWDAYIKVNTFFAFHLTLTHMIIEPEHQQSKNGQDLLPQAIPVV